VDNAFLAAPVRAITRAAADSMRMYDEVHTAVRLG
jgi:hypothetical protein